MYVLAHVAHTDNAIRELFARANVDSVTVCMIHTDCLLARIIVRPTWALMYD